MLLCLVVLAVGLLAPAAPASAARADFEDAAAAAARHDDLLALKRQPALSHHHESICESLDWRKKALKLVAEIPAAGLFMDLQNATKFEASSVARVGGAFGGGLAVVFDNLHDVGLVGTAPFQALAPRNRLAPVAGKSGAGGEDSEYEGVTPRSRTGTLLLVNEGVAQRKHEADDTFWRGLVREVSPPAAARGALEVVRECLVDYKLTEGDTHGFEGSHYVDAGSEGELLFLLCEGNHCEGKKGRGKETGNGRIVVARFDAGNSSAPCAWRTQKVLEIPSTADFLDFADLDIEHAARGQSRIAVVSQEDAALWLGRIDLEKLEFMGDGEVLHFPRGADCLELYCNVEGVAFLDADRLMTVTDRAKSDQPWRCVARDQSVQIFALPYNKHIPHPHARSPGAERLVLA